MGEIIIGILRVCLAGVIGLPCLIIANVLVSFEEEVDKWIAKDPFWAYYILKYILMVITAPFAIGAGFMAFA